MESVLCKYYLHGACSKGSSCPYAHDLKAKSSIVCKYYASGVKCVYGKTCCYDHVKPTPPVLRPVNDISRVQGSHSSLSVLKSKKQIDKEKRLEWASAAEFVPGRQKHTLKDVVDEQVSELPSGSSYSEAAAHNLSFDLYDVEDNEISFDGDSHTLLCPFAAVRDCPYGEKCEYMHGLECHICGHLCLHPTDLVQQKEHQDSCMEFHEKEMERAFAAQRSDAISCSICLDLVKEKTDITERVFGILENCTHPFCLSCIRAWRKSSSQNKSVVRSCPICRVNSWFVTPSEFWVEEEEEKKRLIENYKSYIGTKHCRNYDFGNGSCPFGSSCFYKHASKNGEDEKEKPTLRHREDALGEFSVVKDSRLNEFLERRT